MKNLVICSLVLLFISCAESKNMSHTETAQIVAQSFFSKNESALKPEFDVRIQQKRANCAVFSVSNLILGFFS